MLESLTFLVFVKCVLMTLQVKLRPGVAIKQTPIYAIHIEIQVNFSEAVN